MPPPSVPRWMVTNSRIRLRWPMRVVGSLAVIFQVLRRDADGRVREEDVVFADFERAFHEYVRHDSGARADFDIRSDDEYGPISADSAMRAPGIDDRGRVNRHRRTESVRRRSASLHSIVASATTTPSTLAVPNILAMRRFAFGHLHFDAQLIAGAHRLAEFRFFDAWPAAPVYSCDRGSGSAPGRPPPAPWLP